MDWAERIAILATAVALMCSTYAALTLKSKGRSGTAGFILGLFLGPIGLAVALLIEPAH